MVDMRTESYRPTDTGNEFRTSERYLDVRGSALFVEQSDIAFFGLAVPVTTEKSQ